MVVGQMEDYAFSKSHPGVYVVYSPCGSVVVIHDGSYRTVPGVLVASFQALTTGNVGELDFKYNIERLPEALIATISHQRQIHEALVYLRDDGCYDCQEHEASSESILRIKSTTYTEQFHYQQRCVASHCIELRHGRSHESSFDHQDGYCGPQFLR
jgi:hypothetical protein